MKNLIKSMAMFAILASIISCSNKQTQWSVDSPSENILFKIFLDENNQLMYNVSHIESGIQKQVIANSPLGIRRTDASFIDNLEFVAEDADLTISESFSLPTGKQKVISTEVNILTLTFKNQTGAQIQIIARVSDDGVAFRYRFPELDSNLFSVEEELTGFAIAGEGKTWMAPYDKVTMYSPGYERYFENGIPIGTAAPDEEGWCLPALFQIDNAWMLLTEAALDSTYFGSHLQPNAEGGLYTIRMPEAAEAK